MKAKKSVGLISQKKKQLCTCSTLFMYISLQLFCTTTPRNFQKLPSYMFYAFLLTLFSLPLIFTLVAASISSLFKIFMFFFQRNWSPLFFFSRSSSLSVIHVNVDIKIKSKYRIGFVVVVCISKVREDMRFTAKTHGRLKCKLSSRLTWRRGRTYGRFSQNQNFLDA